MANFDPNRDINNFDTEQNINKNIKEVSSTAPESTGGYASYNFSPLGLRFSTQMVNGKRIINSFLTIFILLIGLGAGLVLVRNPQIFKERAQNGTVVACSELSKCVNDASNIPAGAKACLSRTGVNFCCPEGQVIINNACTRPPRLCDSNLHCSKDKSYGTFLCSNVEGEVLNCCKKGYKLNEVLNFCYKPLF